MKHIEAYFETENDAASVKAKLETYHIEDETVEKVPSDNDPFAKLLLNFFKPNSSDGFRPYLLQFKVSEDDYEEANQIVKNNSGYIKKQ